MKKRFEFYWPIFNLLGIVLVLWSLTIVNVNPVHDSKREALLDSTYNEEVYEAGLKEGKLFDQRNNEEASYPFAKKNSKLVINF